MTTDGISRGIRSMLCVFLERRKNLENFQRVTTHSQSMVRSSNFDRLKIYRVIIYIFLPKFKGRQDRNKGSFLILSEANERCVWVALAGIIIYWNRLKLIFVNYLKFFTIFISLKNGLAKQNSLQNTFLGELEPLVLTIRKLVVSRFELSKLEDLSPQETYLASCFVL